MPEVTIAGTLYIVSPLEGAAYWRYIFYIGDLARAKLNPWQDLFAKVKGLPANHQEIAFWRLYHEDLYAVSEQDMYRFGALPESTRLLVRLMIPGPDAPLVTAENAAAIFAELYPHIEKGPERLVSGPEALAMVHTQAARERELEDVGNGD